MKNKKYIWCASFVFFFLAAFGTPLENILFAGDMDSLRILYYRSVEDESSLDKTLTYIEDLRRGNRINDALLTVYEGSLTGLKGKHALSPRKKYHYVMESLPMMEKARRMDSTNVEILFIQGTTTYYLPFFFHQQKRAVANFHAIVRLLPQVHHEYPADLVVNVINFLEEHSHLCPDEKACLEDMLKQLRRIYGE
jgi:hypothetical protein